MIGLPARGARWGFRFERFMDYNAPNGKPPRAGHGLGRGGPNPWTWNER